MAITEEQILAWRHAREDEHLEFKAAERSFDFDDLARYCAALANEGGGSLVLGITDGLPRHAENILDRSVPRNRRIADALAKCGLVERGGQGMDLMYRRCIESAKALPDFSGTDEYQVRLCLEGTVQDTRVLRFLEEINSETLATFSVKDLLLLNCILFERRIPAALRDRSASLIQKGIVESVGRKLIPSRRFHAFLGKKGTYTRRRGLDRDTNKALLLKHIRENAREGSPLSDLQQVLPSHPTWLVKALLQEMKMVGQVRVAGRTRQGRWYPAA